MSPRDMASERFISVLTKNSMALILAGGRGSRLKDLTKWRAKPSVQFGGKFRIIDFPLSNCINSGIRRVGVVTQYKAHSLIQHIQHGWSFLRGEFNEFVELLPAQQRMQEEWYKGTADAVYQNLDILRGHAPRHIIILAGDHIYKMDYGKLLASHVSTQADMTIACLTVPIADAHAFGVMTVNTEGRIVSFDEKPEQPNGLPDDPDRALASMGIYVFSSDFLFEQLARDAEDPDSTHDFGHDLIPWLVPRHRVFAQPFEESCVGEPDLAPYWRDVGTVDAYWEANMEMTKVVPDLNLYDKNWPIWTYQEQFPPAKFVFDEDGRRGYAVDSLISGGNIISGGVVRRSVLFSDVHVKTNALVEDAVVLPNVRIGKRARLRRVVIDRGCIIPDELVAGYDPVQDRERFYVSENGITLITAEMLNQRNYHPG